MVCPGRFLSRLPVSAEQAANLKEGSQIALVDAQGALQAIMTLEEKFGYDKQLEAIKVYRTTEEAHPGVHVLYQQGDVYFKIPHKRCRHQNIKPLHDVTKLLFNRDSCF